VEQKGGGGKGARSINSRSAGHYGDLFAILARTVLKPAGEIRPNIFRRSELRPDRRAGFPGGAARGSYGEGEWRNSPNPNEALGMPTLRAAQLAEVTRSFREGSKAAGG